MCQGSRAARVKAAKVPFTGHVLCARHSVRALQVDSKSICVLNTCSLRGPEATPWLTSARTTLSGSPGRKNNVHVLSTYCVPRSLQIIVLPAPHHGHRRLMAKSYLLRTYYGLGIASPSKIKTPVAIYTEPFHTRHFIS